MEELVGLISCVLLMHMEDIINHLDFMMAAEVGNVHYQQIQRPKH